MKNVDISTYHLMAIIMFQYVWFSEHLTKSLKLLRLIVKDGSSYRAEDK